MFDPNQTDPSLYGMGDPFNQDQVAASGWHPMGDPSIGMVPHQPTDPSGYCMPQVTPGITHFLGVHGFRPHRAESNHAAVTETLGGDHTPFKYNPNHQVPMSPYWGHLDHATLAMMGLASPQGQAAPQTPARRKSPAKVGFDPQEKDEASGIVMNAQPLILRQQYYSYGVSYPSR